MNTSLARKGTVEAITRRLGVQMAWSCAGRSAETGTCVWNGLEWDPQKTAVFVEIKQFKTGKVKIIPFCAGVDRDACFYLAMGDYLASAKPANWNAGDAWIIPKLAVSTNTSGTTLGDWIRALRPRERDGAVGYRTAKERRRNFMLVQFRLVDFRLTFTDARDPGRVKRKRGGSKGTKRPHFLWSRY